MKLGGITMSSLGINLHDILTSEGREKENRYEKKRDRRDDDDRRDHRDDNRNNNYRQDNRYDNRNDNRRDDSRRDDNRNNNYRQDNRYDNKNDNRRDDNRNNNYRQDNRYDNRNNNYRNDNRNDNRPYKNDRPDYSKPKFDNDRPSYSKPDRRDNNYDRNARPTVVKSRFEDTDYIAAAMDVAVEKRRSVGGDKEDEFLSKLNDETNLTILKKKLEFDDFAKDYGIKIAASIFKRMNENPDFMEQKIADFYAGSFDRMVGFRVSELKSSIKAKHRPASSLLAQIALEVPSSEVITEDNLMTLVHEVNRCIYNYGNYEFESEDIEAIEKGKISKEITPKMVKNIYKAVFGEDNLTKCVMYALLEPKEYADKLDTNGEKTAHGAVSKCALDVIDELDDDDERAAVLIRYITFRKSNGGVVVRRRMSLQELDREDYSRLVDSVAKLSRDIDYRYLAQ
jgi:hypothetical protein